MPMLVLNADTGVSMVQDNTVDPKTDIVKNIPCFSAYQGVTQSILTTNTKVSLTLKEFDVTNAFDNITNFRFTPQVAGYYNIVGSISLATETAVFVQPSIVKNSVVTKRGSFDTGAVGKYPYSNVSCIIYMNGSTDYIELYAIASAVTNSNPSLTAIFLQANLIVGA